MPRPYTLYIDETGNRHPDKASDKSRVGRDWFGYGGVLIRGEHNDDARNLVSAFSNKWNLRKPAHMTDMLSERKGFSWLGKISQERRDEFWRDWRSVLINAEVIGIGCIIDRPGYINRGYLEAHEDKWMLCRSAFDITVDRAAKIARLEERKLHVVFEQDAGINSTITDYFKNLKQNGLAFDAENSGKYAPLSQTEFCETLGRIEHKPKSHTLLQIADSYIYSMARNGYDKKFPIYRALRDHRKLANFSVPQEHIKTMGVKYYCFD